jgi:hypothetical protein
VVLAVILALVGAASADEPAFGMDVSAGIGGLGVLGEWPDPGVEGVGTARVDLFPVPRDAPGVRVGASVWARGSVWPLQTATPDGGSPAAFNTRQYGLHAVFRYDPRTPLTGTFGFGFSRLDIAGYEDGVWTVPMFSVEAGLRQAVGLGFVDYGVSSGWGSARGADGGWQEWWTVGASVSVGYHAK